MTGKTNNQSLSDLWRCPQYQHTLIAVSSTVAVALAVITFGVMVSACPGQYPFDASVSVISAAVLGGGSYLILHEHHKSAFGLPPPEGRQAQIQYFPKWTKEDPNL